MSIEGWLLLATALLAVVAVTAAVVAVRAVRRLDHTEMPAPQASATEPADPPEAPVHVPTPVRLVEGRVIATPTEQQVVATALGRPSVRVSVYVAGLAHALRPESRDRISALMRREYRHRRRARQRVARRAARAVPSADLRRDDSWLGSTPHVDPDRTRSLPRAVGE